MALTRVNGSVDNIFDTVADMKGADLPAGSYVETKGYYTAGEGGAAKYLIQTAAEFGATPDGYGDHLLANGNVAVLHVKGDIDILQFGAKGDDSTDDAAAIQAAIDYAAGTGYVKSNIDTGGQAFLGAKQSISFPTRVFRLGTTVSIPSNYDNINFGKALFMPHATFDQATFAFDITAWNTEFIDLRLAGFEKGIKIGNANLNIGVIKFNGLQATNIDKLFEMTLRSSLTKIEDYRFDSVKVVAEILDGDKVVFKDGWLSAGIMNNANDAHFILNSAESPGLTLNDFFYVPSVQTATGTAIVKNINSAARITFEDCLCGGEPGQIPLVSNYADGVSGVTRGGHITINNTIGFTASSGSAGGARAAVELHALPNSIVFNDYYGGIEESHTAGLVQYVDDVKTYDQAVTDLGNARFEIQINGRTPSNFSGLVNSSKTKFAKFDRSEFEVTRDYAKDVTNAVGHTTLTKAQAGLGVSYKIILFNSFNNGADRYSEYFLASNSVPSPNGSWSLFAINEGSSTVAGRAIINGSGDVEIRGNSVAVTSIVIIKQKLSNTEII